jgi:hypothetical protein
MNEEIDLINTNTRNEKIKNFFIHNKSKIISAIIIVVILFVIIFAFGEYQKKLKKEISDKFNSATISYNVENKDKTFQLLVEVINSKNPTYSPLALYFIIDNKLSEDKNEIINFFNILIEETSLEDEIKNLVIYKKALFSADSVDEIELLNILKPINNSNSVWKSHSLYLIAEYFFSKGEKQKAKEFFEQIEALENANSEIKIQSQKRLNRDLSE